MLQTLDTTKVDSGDPSQYMEVDPWSWVYFHRMKLFGGPYSVYGHEFQVDVLQCLERRQCAKKSPQMFGLTEAMVIRILHGLRFGRYPQGALYLFPTSDEVSDFSKSRFKPFLKNNYDAIGRYVKDTDTAEVKKVMGKFLFLRGARLQDIDGAQKSSSKLKSLPVDVLVGDEIDEMDDGALQLALGRMDASNVKEEFYLANPTVPEWGIDVYYANSDKRVWMIECEQCGRENCLELEFPNCLRRIRFSNVSEFRDPSKDGGVIRVCRQCGHILNPRKGYWVAREPSKTKDMVGWWISHLNSPYTDPAEILNEFEDPLTDMVRFYNRRLAMAYVNAEDRLSKADVYRCCGPDAMAMSDPGPCCAGADVQGNELMVLIARKIHEHGLKIIRVARVPTFNDFWDLCQRFHVVSAVMDLRPEIHSVREFCQKANFRAFGCEYSEEQKGVATWNDASRVVTVNRTEIFDASHKQVTEPGWLEIPRKDDEIREFAKQMCATVKVLEDKKAGGNIIGKIYRYRKLGKDDYRNAMNYLVLAAQRAPVASVSDGFQGQEINYYYG